MPSQVEEIFVRPEDKPPLYGAINIEEGRELVCNKFGDQPYSLQTARLAKPLLAK